MTPLMDSGTDLRLLLDSAYPLVLAEVRDEERFLDLLRGEAAGSNRQLWVWSMTSGLARDGMGPQYGTAQLDAALAFIGDIDAPAVFVFADAHPMLTEPMLVRAVKEAAGTVGRRQTLVLTAPHHTVPPELEGVAVAWTLRPPDDSRLAELVSRTIDDLVGRGVAVTLDDRNRRELVGSLRGLTLAAADRIIQQAVLRDGRLDSDDIRFARAERFATLGADGVLELVHTETRTLDDVAGLDGLKGWLTVRGAAVGDPAAEAMGIDPPRGVLLTGIPGCGKSFVAKALASSWGVPLLLLDPGRIYRKYVGESEQRLERALEIAETMAPVVLWIDEIEKGFATSDGDTGVSSRVLGTFLRWLQDRSAGVFVAATANDVSLLPPELLRKGRFDEVFFVDLPAAGPRRAMLIGHLRGRGHDPATFDVDKLVEVTDGFSGAEVEALVVGALYRAFGAGSPLTTEELLDEASNTVPLSVARPEQIAALRSWAEGRAVPA